MPWEPLYAFTNYPGPWYMSEWLWGSLTIALMLAVLYLPRSEKECTTLKQKFNDK